MAKSAFIFSYLLSVRFLKCSELWRIILKMSVSYNSNERFSKWVLCISITLCSNLVRNLSSNHSTDGTKQIEFKDFNQLHLLKNSVVIGKTSKFLPIKAQEELNQLNDDNSKMHKMFILKFCNYSVEYLDVGEIFRYSSYI